MGNSNESPIIKNSFRDTEAEKLSSLFEGCSIKKNKEHKLEENKFIEVFAPQHPTFGPKFLIWMKLNAQLLKKDDLKGRPKNHKMLNAYMLSMEALLRSYGSDIYFKSYAGMKIIEIIMLILFTEKQDTKPMLTIPEEINKEKAIDLLQFILSLIMINSEIKCISENELNPILDVIFESETSIPTFNFQRSLSILFPSLSRYILESIESITLNAPKYTEESPPIYINTTLSTTTPSDIVTPLMIVYTQLLIPQLQNIYKISRIYSSNTDGFSFNRLTYQIIHYTAPTLIFLKHYDKEKQEINIIGIFQDGEIKDTARYDSGTLNNCIFILSPTLKTIRTYPQTGGGKNYAYLNTRKIEGSDYKCGLAWGGKVGEGKLWLDRDLPDGCYMLPQDDTYEIGFIINGKELNIRTVEVWGCGDKDTLAIQERMRALDLKKQNKAKQVDKSAFLDNEFDKEMLFAGKFTGVKKE